jgi:hypothetical protein
MKHFIAGIIFTVVITSIYKNVEFKRNKSLGGRITASITNFKNSPKTLFRSPSSLK